MINKLRMFVFLGLLIVGVIFISGCVQENDPTKRQTQESNPLLGTWKLSGTDGIYVFNKDNTGYFDTGSNSAIYSQNGKSGKTFFKYNIDVNKITIYDIVPCSKSYYPCKNPSNIEYEFIDKNTLILGNAVLEKSKW